ncbi:MAG: excinuclease ABC subunit UvrB [Candidatus Nanoarchaeia archaeon]
MDNSRTFRLKSNFVPRGSQPQAIKKLICGINRNDSSQTLLGVTGSGKTFTMANVVAGINKPTLVVAHNKTLAAQLYNEFKELFPENRVEFFVSYYDYYQPESYLPQKDQYIEKDAQINSRIEQMRLSATASVLSRNDTIIVSSISCIYGLGNPENFRDMGFEIKKGNKVKRKNLLQNLIKIQFERNDIELMPGRFRVKGDVIDVIPGYHKDIIRIELFGDEIEGIKLVEKKTGKVSEELDYFHFFPAKHFVIPETSQESAIESIKQELEEELPKLGLIEAHRLKQRTMYDIEMIEETGYCKGIENYSRHFDFRKPGEKPYCLLDYFPEDFLLIIDESHQTIPQSHGMHKGDYSRKKALVDYGFRLPSAFDNRPLTFNEFEKYFNSTIFVSATPGEYELKNSSQVVEQIIRPTGLVDPVVSVRKTLGQIENLKDEINKTIDKGFRVLVTTLTKKLSEELTDFLIAEGIKAKYLHSEIDTLQRSEIIRELRLGEFDVLVGINLLREGLDIPEIGFIGIMDADKEGFLRNQRSLIQTIGRAARNSESYVIMYADNVTESMRKAIDETERRRSLQIEFNEKHNIIPETIVKPIKEKEVKEEKEKVDKKELPNLLIELETEMKMAADNMDFERAIELRERIKRLKNENN